MEKILTYADITEITGRSYKTIWVWWSKDGTFPQPIKRAGRVIGWRESAVKDWIEANVSNDTPRDRILDIVRAHYGRDLAMDVEHLLDSNNQY